jgi:hypothetical protein
VLRKFFPLDKNYLLKEAQSSLEDKLLQFLLEKVKTAYQQKHNPLGLNDSFVSRIINYSADHLSGLSKFYETLAAVYRYKWGDSQLEFLWDGADHQEKYKEDWTVFFNNCTTQFCQEELFLQAVLDVTVFQPTSRIGELAESRMNHFMLHFFEVRFHKSKGLVASKAA